MTPRISETVKQDHGEIQACYDRIVNSTNQDEQVRFQNLFVWELARHSVGEEIVVYPAFEKHVEGGKAMAEKDRAEHQKIKEQLKRFQQLDPSHHDFLSTLVALMEDLSRHIQEEESTDLVALEDALTEHDSQHLSKTFERTKIFVPSRAHPSSPNRPPFETAVGLMTAPFDQLADLLRKWPTKESVGE